MTGQRHRKTQLAKILGRKTMVAPRKEDVERDKTGDSVDRLMKREKSSDDRKQTGTSRCENKTRCVSLC